MADFSAAISDGRWCAAAHDEDVAESTWYIPVTIADSKSLSLDPLAPTPTASVPTGPEVTTNPENLSPPRTPTARGLAAMSSRVVIDELGEYVCTVSALSSTRASPEENGVIHAN